MKRTLSDYFPRREAKRPRVFGPEREPICYLLDHLPAECRTLVRLWIPRTRERIGLKLTCRQLCEEDREFTNRLLPSYFLLIAFSTEAESKHEYCLRHAAAVFIHQRLHTNPDCVFSVWMLTRQQALYTRLGGVFLGFKVPFLTRGTPVPGHYLVFSDDHWQIRRKGSDQADAVLVTDNPRTWRVPSALWWHLPHGSLR